MNKRQFLKLAAAAAASLATPRILEADAPAAPQTYTYKTVNGCALRADVYGARARTKKRAIVRIHGGALIFGTRDQPPQWLNPDGDCVVISIEYRLAPKTKLPAIIEDLRDAFAWLHHRGSALLGIDRNRIAVTGQSAGGYLTLMTGFAVRPRPRALLALSGYGDITRTWYTCPSPFYLQQPAIPKEEAYRGVGDGCVSKLGDEDKRRAQFYVYCRQKGIWPEEVAGHDPDVEPRWFDPYCPVRNVSAHYPPTVLIHGTADTDVPFDESGNMEWQFSRFKTKHDFLRVPDGSHCLWKDPPEVKAEVFKKAMEFVRMELG